MVLRMTFALCLLIGGYSPWVAMAAPDASLFMPKTREIEIKTITQDVIDVRPGGAVKIIFPWVLSENDDELPYMAKMATDNVFAFEAKEGQNVIIVYYKNFSDAFENEVVDLTVSTHGYHFTFAIRANFNPKDYYSNVVLKMSDAEMLALLDREKKKYMAYLAQERQKMLEELDLRAHQKALALVGELSNDDPEETRIKEESELELANGDKITAYVDVAKHYGEFSVFNFEVENDSEYSPVYIKNVELFKLDESGVKVPVRAVFNLPPKIPVGGVEAGTLSTLEDLPLTNMVLAVTTDKGPLEVSW